VRLLLIYPYAQPDSPLWMPLGLAFMAAELRRAGHTVAIFDRFAAQFQHDLNIHQVNAAMLDQVRRFQPDLIGLSTVSPMIYDTADSAALIRETFSGPLVAGGYHATALPELTLQKIPELDGVFTGEGETALTQLANGQRPGTIPGLWWHDNERIRPPTAPAVQISSLDSLALPALDLMDMDLYLQRNDGVIRRHNLRAVTFITSRGCAMHCSFCAESLTYGQGVRWHSSEYVLEWIASVLREYGIDGIHFHDNDWLANEARAHELCEAMIERGWNKKISWSIQTRSDRITAGLARLLKRAGCSLVEIGIEAGTQKELDRIGKRTGLDVNSRAVRLCRQAGLDVHAYMITRLPGETVEDLEQRLAWLKRNRVTSFQWSPLNLYPGTVMYAKYGQDYYARHEWTRANLERFYSVDTLSAIPPRQRHAWMQKHLGPFSRRHWWRNAIHQYPAGKLLPVALAKLRRRLEKLGKFRGSGRPTSPSPDPRIPAEEPDRP
jgi:anaerobic magnesium-protoporphyrin IX monomethyl ester cyclase